MIDARGRQCGEKLDMALCEQYRCCPHLLDMASDGVLLIDCQGRFTFANTAVTRIVGLPREEILSRTLYDPRWKVARATGEPLPDDERPFSHVMQTGEAVRGIELSLERADGVRIVASFNNSPLYDRQGKIEGMIVLITDITERRQAEDTLRESEETAHALLDASTDAAFLVDLNGEIMAINETGARRFGKSIDEAIGLNALQDFPEDIAAARLQHIQAAMRTGEAVRFEDERDGRFLDNCIYPILDARGQVTRLAIYSRDITRQKLGIERLRLHAKQQTAVAELGQRALSGIDVKTLIDDALHMIAEVLNVEYCEVFQYAPDNRLLLSAGVGWPEAMIGTASLPLSPSENMQTEPLAKEHRIAVTRLPIATLLPDAGLVSGIVVNVQGRSRPYGTLGVHSTDQRVFTATDNFFLQGVANILGAAVEQKRYEEELKYLSTHDALTGLYNRAFFEAEINRLDRSRRFPVSMMIVDVDGLKVTNDTLGHQEGDDLLRRTAAVLGTSFRGEDMVARIGGDEFAVILPYMDGRTAYEALLRVRQQFAAESVVPGKPTLVVSIGVATAAVRERLTEALTQADAMMYQEKQAHKSGRLSRAG